MKRNSLSQHVRLACTDQVNRALCRSALLGIPASTVLALILGPSVPASRRLTFVLLVTLADVATFWGSVRYLARRKRGDVMRHYWFGPFSMALTGLAWASLALIALPDAKHHADLRAVFLLFIVASSATSVVGTAARRLYYFASQIPMLGVVCVTFLASGDRVSRLLGFAVPIYFIVMTSLHHEVHTVVLSELQLQEKNDEANVQLRSANTQLSQQALRDDLTGLANRPAFMARLDAAVVNARRDQTTIGVLYLDIDRFKVINDSLGHAVGDMVLAEAARRIMSIIRGPDVLARLGGDEFTMLLDGVHGRREAIAIAERVAGVLAAPFDLAGRRFNVSASIGIATNLDTADDGEALLSHADAAQYRAKQGGRNRIEVFDIELRESIQRRLGDEQELRDALDRSDIIAWYQPEVELRTGRVVGAEALARWMHADRGMLDAGHFVPLAEEAGIVFRLDDRIVIDAVQARAGLARAGIDPSFRIWCNVSSGQLTRARPAERLAAVLSAVGCDPSQIGIEITETAILPDVKAAAYEIAAARELGIKVALDDFGTGHSSLTLLRSLPIDRVKIDQSFVREITRDASDAAIVRSVITLANDLGLEVVAEGVESPEQAQVLVQLGCQYAQGYLWAKALPIDELTVRLRDQLHGVATDVPTPQRADHRTGRAPIVAG